MNRRDFLKNALTAAALAPVVRVAAQSGLDGKANAQAADANVKDGVPQVSRRRWKNTELFVPLLGFGCMRLPLVSPDKPDIDYEKTKKMIDMAMDSGVCYFDTAYMYHDGRSEVCLGELLKEYPRSSYFLVDKMPPWFAENAKDVERIFQEQLKRCRTDHFDFYLIHSLDETNWALTQKYDVYAFLDRMKREGRIRRLGFSFHDAPELLRKIVDAHPWDFAQIQLNCLDWDLYRSREQYDILTKAGIPVVVMEPLRGGSLATLVPDAVEILKQAKPEASVASWSLRYAASLPNVMCVLSGMSSPEQVADNIRTFSPLTPLSDAERQTLERALAAYRKRLAVPCTACRYCMPCPVGVEIPRIFGLYNQYKAIGNPWLFSNNYGAIPKDSRADACVECGKCVKHCPQKIDIPAELKKIAREVESLPTE